MHRAYKDSIIWH